MTDDKLKEFEVALSHSWLQSTGRWRVVAAFTPPDALALIAEVRRLRQRIVRQRSDVFDYSGGGRISVPVSSIVNSAKVARQVSAVTELERESMTHPGSTGKPERV